MMLYKQIILQRRTGCGHRIAGRVSLALKCDQYYRLILFPVYQKQSADFNRYRDLGNDYRKIDLPYRRRLEVFGKTFVRGIVTLDAFVSYKTQLLICTVYRFSRLMQK